MAYFTGMGISCGVRQLIGVHDDSPSGGLRNAFRYPDNGPRCAHVVFSDTTSGHGKRFAAFIVKKGLGTVISTPARVNPNSRNRIVVWVWTINKAGLRRWLKEQRP